MGYLAKTITGLGLLAGGLVLANVKLVQLLDIGTCASGNTPYAISRPCPAGTGTAILLLTAGIFIVLIGAGLFAARGTSPWSRGGSPHRISTGSLVWGLGFSATGATALIAARTHESISAGGKLGGTIVGITFLVMGLPVLGFAIWDWISSLGSRDERPSAAAGAGATAGSSMTMGGAMGGMLSGLRFSGTVGGSASSGAAGGDAIARLERLQRLRESGALSDREFEREKAKILAE